MADLLRVENLRAGYGEAIVIDGVDMTLGEGRSLALLGRNGVGKTTLLTTLVGITRRRAGTITIGGNDITHLRPEQRVAAGLGWVPQERNIFKSLTVDENLTAVALFVMAGIFFAALPQPARRTGLFKGVSFALLVWFFRVVMSAASQSVMFKRSCAGIALFPWRWIGRDADPGRAVWADLEGGLIFWRQIGSPGFSEAEKRTPVELDLRCQDGPPLLWAVLHVLEEYAWPDNVPPVPTGPFHTPSHDEVPVSSQCVGVFAYLMQFSSLLFRPGSRDEAAVALLVRRGRV